MSAVVSQKIRDYYVDNVDAYREKCALFIASLHEKGIVRRACADAGLDRTTPYIWRANDPEFREAWDNALEDATDEAEESLFDMATSRRNVVATIFYLKNNRHKYRDRVTIDVTGAQREIEDQLDGVRDRAVSDESLRRRLPSASAKDIIADALGITRRQTTSQSPVITVEPANTGNSDSSQE